MGVFDMSPHSQQPTPWELSLVAYLTSNPSYWTVQRDPQPIGHVIGVLPDARGDNTDHHYITKTTTVPLLAKSPLSDNM